MLLSADMRAKARLARARKEPLLPFIRDSLVEIVEATRRQLFPALSVPLEVHFVRQGPLACVCDFGDARPVIFVHVLLNHHEVPSAVWRFIAIHELLHLVVPGREVDGRYSDHPPEFFARERELVPDREAVWQWIWVRYGHVLRRDERKEGTFVVRDWRSRLRSSPEVDRLVERHTTAITFL